ncbi:MAG: acyl carrier protein [Clostridia bacterium]|nr:acyl carrier protein [Clostridia bacterium]
MDNFEKIKKILIDEIGIEKDKILPASDLRDDLHFNSLEFAQLANSVEEEFSVSIPDEALEDVRTVQDILDLLEK